MKAKAITMTDINDRTVHGQRYTNLGAGFHLDVGGATHVTIHRYGNGHHRNDADERPTIDWVNTYGNVTANNGQYRFTYAGAVAADQVLRSIEADHAAKEATK